MAFPDLGDAAFAEKGCFRQSEGGALAPALAPHNSLASFGPDSCAAVWPCAATEASRRRVRASSAGP
jgi:hypothetical protein